MHRVKIKVATYNSVAYNIIHNIITLNHAEVYDNNYREKHASVGMYSGCDKLSQLYKSCLYTFRPCHPYFILQLFLYLYKIIIQKEIHSTCHYM